MKIVNFFQWIFLVGIPISQLIAQETFQYPVNLPVSFGSRQYNYQLSATQYHTGADYLGQYGNPIYATASGEVVHKEVMSSNDHGMGYNFIIKHILLNGSIRYSFYGHMNSLSSNINVGDFVFKGQQIGTMGNSGYGCANYWTCNPTSCSCASQSWAHLHFEFKSGPLNSSSPTANSCNNGLFWGYTPNHPDSYCYEDPRNYLGPSGVKHTSTPVAISPVSISGAGIPVVFSWSSVPNAVYRLQVFKSINNSPSWSAKDGFSSTNNCGGQLVVNVNIPSGNQFLWNSIISNSVCELPQPTTQYYWTVKSYVNGSGSSAYSLPQTFITGSNSTVTTPINITASDGNYSDRVAVSWSGTSGNFFRVYRNTVNNSSTATALGTGWQTSTSFNDYSAVAGTIYYYWVRAASNSSGSNPSTYGGPNTGYRASTPTVTTPTNVNASDGNYSDRVAVSWSGTSGNFFRVYRNTVNNSSTATALGTGWQTSTSFNDFSAIAGTIYYYWVRAASSSSGSNPSAYGGPNTGYRASTPPPPNDNPCSATTIVAGSTCSYTNGTNVGATNTTNPGAPTSCPYSPYDVWYKVQVPTSGIVTIRTWAGTLTNAVMAIYYGTCSSLLGIVCEDNNTNGSGSLMPVITITGYSPGTWLHIRIWGANSATGTFQICAMNYSTTNATDTGDESQGPAVFQTHKSSDAAAWNFSPNPTSGMLYGRIQLDETMEVSLNLRDLNGKIIRKLLSETVAEGESQFDFNLYGVAPGTYIIHGFAGSKMIAERIVVVK